MYMYLYMYMYMYVYVHACMCHCHFVKEVGDRLVKSILWWACLFVLSVSRLGNISYQTV